MSENNVTENGSVVRLHMQSPNELRASANKSCLALIMERLRLMWRPGDTVTVDVMAPMFTKRGIDVDSVVEELKNYGWKATGRKLDEGWQFTVTEMDGE